MNVGERGRRRGSRLVAMSAIYFSPEPSDLSRDLMDYSLVVNNNLKMDQWMNYKPPEYYHNLPKCYQLQASFVEQPPEDLRKSNFFRFTAAFKDFSNEPVDIVQARFGNYLNEIHEGDLRNGIKYYIKFRFSDGSFQEKDLYLTLLDAAKLEPIRYEGQDDNPKMKRVLITHETICTRCIQQKSCGNKNEAPSDPLIVERGSLRFFLKCNQNCLKGAGNPKDMRRFSLVLSFEDITHNRQGILAISEKMFVHNNSKNSRKRKRSSDSYRMPNSTKVLHYFPRTGPCSTEIVIYGENFEEGTKVIIGNMEIASEMISEKVIEARIPYLLQSQVLISLFVPNKILTIPVGLFTIRSQKSAILATVSPKIGVCGEEIIIISKEIASGPNVSVVCNGNPLLSKVVHNSAIIVTIPLHLMPGEVTLSVFWNSALQFWFQYDIQSQMEPSFHRQTGQLLICLSGRQAEFPVCDPCDEIREALISRESYFLSSSSPSSSTSSHSPYTSPSYLATSSSPDSALHS